MLRPTFDRAELTEEAARRFAELLDGKIARRLRTIPGVGPSIAATLPAEIGDIGRFDDFDQLLAWASSIMASAPLDIYRSINPYSEAGFKMLKDRLGFPDRFGSIEDARAFCRTFFTWYNEAHRHAGIGLLTPAAVHTGQGPAVHAARSAVLADAYAAHPERFVRQIPQPPAQPTAVWINKPEDNEVPPQQSDERSVPPRLTGSRLQE